MHVPEGWNEEKLGDLFEFKNGANTEAANYGSGIKFVNVMDIFGNNILTCEKIKESVNLPANKADLYRLKMGDVLFNRTSETFDEIALSSVYLDSKFAIFGGFVIRGRPVSKSLNHQFCVYCFSSSNVRKELIRRGQGAIRANIGQADIRHVPLLVPPLPEQQKIAQILSTWDKAIEKLESLIAAKQKRKKALMQQLLTGMKRVAGFDGEWKKISLKNVLRVRKELSLPTEDNPLYSLTIESGVTEKTDRYNREFLVRDTENKKYKLVYPNDIVYNPANLRWGAINISRINHKVVVSPIYEVLYIKNISEYCHSFISHLLMSPRQVAIFACMAEGTLVERMAVKIETFLATSVLLPSSIAEQQKIASVLSAADTEIQTHQKQLSALKEQKRGLMQQLLTGKKRVIIDEPELLAVARA